MSDTLIDKLERNDRLFRAMLSMPDWMKGRLPGMRREEMFSFLWEETSMERTEAMNLVNKRELQFVREYEHTEVPEWLLRCEAQDVLLQFMHDEFKEEGLIEE